jgi:hypothetical protein
VDGEHLETDEGPRYVYTTTTDKGLFYFESTRFRGYFLAFDGNTLKLKETTRPLEDDDVNLSVFPADS